MVAPELPSDYITLANLLSLPISADPADFQKQLDYELMVQEHIMTLKRLTPADHELAHIRDLVLDGFQNTSRSIQRLKSLPRPQDVSSTMLEAFIFGALGDIKHGFDLDVQNDQARKAILHEIETLFACEESIDLANQLLVKVVERLLPRTVVQDTHTVVDFDETNFPDRFDVCKLHNTGKTRKNCTVVVELTGAQGHIRKNVHFLKEWPTNTWVYCHYKCGTPFNGKARASKTVLSVKTVKVTIHDPNQTTTQVYAYDETQKAIDIKKHCDGLQFTGRYRPYDPGIILSDERGMFITMTGDALPACRITLTFVKGKQSIAWYWDQTGWAKEEMKLFETPKGGLSFDPERIDMTISFSHSQYQHQLSFILNK